MRLKFGDCTLDLETRELLRSGKPVAIEPKAFRLLELLLRARPKALSKGELQDELWPKTFVSERNLARLVLVVRQLIGDSAREPRFIRTVHGYGYAFSGEASELPGRARRPAFSGVQCRLIWGEREIVLSDGENVLGRDPEAVVWIDRDSVSRRHARIVVSGDSATLEDLGSKNGTYIAGGRIAKPVSISNGQEIRIGSASLVFRVFRASGTTASKVTR
ncbi:MAG TPA: FHA domain-containing protein [Thermoanaerobaculia bacterium]|nr:FHA domain-containing protein [Thermoanaerobaculia bacterium]